MAAGPLDIEADDCSTGAEDDLPLLAAARKASTPRRPEAPATEESAPFPSPCWRPRCHTSCIAVSWLFLAAAWVVAGRCDALPPWRRRERTPWRIDAGSVIGDYACDAADDVVKTLRQLSWPLENAGKAPRISRVIYINLASDAPRRKYMEQRLRELQTAARESDSTAQGEIVVERLNAVEASEVAHGSEYASWRAKGFSETTKPDVRGDWATAACEYSHFEAIRRVGELAESLASRDEVAMIVEDDVEIQPDFWRQWEHEWPYVPPDWDILRVGWFNDFRDCTQTVNAVWDSAGWRFHKDTSCTRRA
eukprot:TRINITY_DN40807_c0_g1_i2.p1 TRINITY_DN40807_c0_g1~~TRINITY_DN40807_c0_g1_i2.p1  ORF type:complete len:325 (+),score=44.16 TRINITY_DN40807_c0_g1_i2:53-976(+)